MKTTDFNKRSKGHGVNLHPLIWKVLVLARTRFEYEIICSYRNKPDQEAAFEARTSNAHFGGSPHNFLPACAADCIPTPLNWKDEAAFTKMSEVILAAAKELGVSMRNGADWDRDGIRREKGEFDAPHFELHPWRSFAKIG